MEIGRKVEPSRKLNTKGCCFLCLKTATIKQTEDLEGIQVIKSISIQLLLRHLQITVQFVNGEPLVGKDFKKEDLQVYLCENCGKMINSFSVLFQKFEKIQLEMNYFLEKIHKCVSQSAKAPELVQNYSKRMTSDLEALSQLAFVDNLRKQVAKESLKKLNVPRLQLVLTRTDKQIKTEISEETSETDDGDFSGSCLAEEISPPRSPNSSVDYETLPENEKLSPSLKPPVKQKPKPSIYHTRGSSTRMYKCNKCDKESKDPSTIIQHFKSVHLKVRHPCDICNKSVFRQVSKLTLHKKTCREKLGEPPKPPALQNTKDGEYFTRQLSTGMYKCKKCDRKLKSPYKLIQHFKSVHLQQRFKCDICNALFSYPSTLLKHKKICRQKLEKKLEEEKDPEFKFICDECGKRFKGKVSLDAHLLGVHKNIDRYPCDLCDKKFKQTKHLRNHRNSIHLGIKFYCGFCNKPFTRKRMVEIHEIDCAKKAALKKEPEEELDAVNTE